MSFENFFVEAIYPKFENFLSSFIKWFIWLIIRPHHLSVTKLDFGDHNWKISKSSSCQVILFWKYCFSIIFYKFQIIFFCYFFYLNHIRNQSKNWYSYDCFCLICNFFSICSGEILNVLISTSAKTGFAFKYKILAVAEVSGVRLPHPLFDAYCKRATWSAEVPELRPIVYFLLNFLPLFSNNELYLPDNPELIHSPIFAKSLLSTSINFFLYRGPPSIYYYWCSCYIRRCITT